MEARIARLEADVAHLRSDVGDVKEDVRGLRNRFEAKFDAVIAALAAMKDSLGDTNTKIETLRGELAVAIARVKLWAVLLYLTLAAGVFSTMARGFGWI